MVLFPLPAGTNLLPWKHPYRQTFPRIPNRTWRRTVHLLRLRQPLPALSYRFREVLPKEVPLAWMHRSSYIYRDCADNLRSLSDFPLPHPLPPHHWTWCRRKILRIFWHCSYPCQSSWHFCRLLFSWAVWQAAHQLHQIWEVAESMSSESLGSEKSAWSLLHKRIHLPDTDGLSDPDHLPLPSDKLFFPLYP